jgi:prophage maintenance system killer protein
MFGMSEAPQHSEGEVVLYKSPDGQIRLDVLIEHESVWLTQKQMVELFGRDRTVISRHIQRAFADDELSAESNVQKMHIASSDKPVILYSLDAVISVGYRVNSARGTQFRIWATRTLRGHLLRGYTLNERRLREKGFGEIEQALGLLARTLTQHELVTGEGAAELDVVQRYARAWRLLLEYDEDRLAETPPRPLAEGFRLTLSAARELIAALHAALVDRGQASSLFGREHSSQLAAILGAIEQTFDGRPLYPSVQMRAAHLLYFVIKDHPFADGNKRIGALLFLEYLAQNGLFLRADGSQRLADNAMVALALLVAASEPVQKDLLSRLIVNLLDDDG